MGNVFRQKWKRANGQSGESRKWYGEYRDKDGIARRVPLATDRQAAQAMLRDLERKAERQRGGLVDDFAETRKLPIDDLVKAYLADLALRGRGGRHRQDAERLLGVVVRECGFATPGAIDPGKLDTFLAALVKPDGETPLSARTRATYRQAAMGFANWLVRKGKLEFNPLARSTRPEGDDVLKRRALRLPELRKLLAAAEARPLDDLKTVRRGVRKGQRVVRLRPETEAAARRLGRERALLYRAAYYTGLRRGELGALLVGDLTLDGPNPGLFLPRERTKGKRDARLPLRADFAADLRAWVAENGLTAASPLLRIPRDLGKVFRRDLALAGIPYRDERGRVFDFHALRKCLATHLNAAGVPIVTAKEFLRHSTVELTAGVYNDEELHDLRGAAERLPDL